MTLETARNYSTVHGNPKLRKIWGQDYSIHSFMHTRAMQQAPVLSKSGKDRHAPAHVTTHTHVMYGHKNCYNKNYFVGKIQSAILKHNQQSPSSNFQL